MDHFTILEFTPTLNLGYRLDHFTAVLASDRTTAAPRQREHLTTHACILTVKVPFRPAPIPITNAHRVFRASIFQISEVHVFQEHSRRLLSTIVSFPGLLSSPPRPRPPQLDGLESFAEPKQGRKTGCAVEAQLAPAPTRHFHAKRGHLTTPETCAFPTATSLEGPWWMELPEISPPRVVATRLFFYKLELVSLELFGRALSRKLPLQRSCPTHANTEPETST